MTIQEYVDQLNIKFKSGKATEHSHRGNLEALLQSLLPELIVTNEPKRSDVGAPDYILTKGKIPVGYIEAKDIDDTDLSGKKKNKEQFSRYKDGLPNLIFTDYLDFHLYREGEPITTVRIAEVQDGQIVGKPENYGRFEDIIKDFGTHIGQTIRSANKLSKMMAGKARLLADVIEKALNADAESDIKKSDRVNESANNTLREQLSAFQNVLIHDIGAKEFADIYAQTIAYGMFAARLHDPTLDTFDRHEAAALIPKTNPFLRKLFQYIAGYDLDDRITWIVDGLADIFRATDVDGLLKNFGKSTQQQDPIIHFYETFLAEYDPSLRKSRGVWYTPEPVVNFIVRAVDDILKDEFGLKDGLADTSKTTVKVNTDVKDKRSSTGYKQEEREVHKVQILDPATGTGTFLAEVIKQIHKRFEGQQGIWKQYVEEHLIPRLNGFEILMASYAMAHLKLDLLLRETGVEPSGSERFRVYLTNSLEEHHPDTGTLFANWLSQEANEANHVKRDTPVMVVMGNPPYSGESSNKGEWIMELMEDYKKEPGGKVKLKERNPKWINDDYVKFIRFSQYFIEKNGEGILAFINNHGFLDNPTFRGMRWNLLKAYDKIYLIDLHGNSKKKEKTPEGGKDENVFDILPGVSINIFLKTKEDKTDKLADVFKANFYGLREEKYDKLSMNSISSLKFSKIELREPNYLFVDKDYGLIEEYEDGFLCNDLFDISGNGMTTAHDDFVIDERSEQLLNKYEKFRNCERDEEILHKKFDVKKKKGWNILEGYDNIQKQELSKFIQPVTYRPFDDKFIFYEDKLVWRTVRKVMENFIDKDNTGIIIGRQGQVVGQMEWNVAFITSKMTDFNVFYRGGGVLFPLYKYPEESTQQTLEGKPERTPNLDQKIVQEIAKKLGLKFVPESSYTEASDERESFAPIDLLDYIYAVLHYPSYRKKYKEFLKIDFPRVPYPEDPKQFWQLVELGGELRQFHLLEHPVVEDLITTYPEPGDNVISNRLSKNDPGFVPEDDDETMGKVWINETQYFGNVPKKAWEFCIGGYQPAEKWLKDRRDRELSINEIRHYQKIIVALMETDEIMREIDQIENFEV
ncbi:MAG: type ISP restriction/modification enzyme [Gracilimonas sp.]